jgi:hypothetical protein
MIWCHKQVPKHYAYHLSWFFVLHLITFDQQHFTAEHSKFTSWYIYKPPATSNELLFLITAVVQTHSYSWIRSIGKKQVEELSENVMKCVHRFCGVDLLPWTRLWPPTVMHLATVRWCSSSSDSIRKRYQVTILRCSCKMALLLSSSSSFVCWKTLFQCPGHIMVHDLNSYDTIVLSILWIDFPNPVSQKRCPRGSPPYVNRTFCAWRYLEIQRKNKLGQAFYWIRMQWTLKIGHQLKKKLKLIWVLEIHWWVAWIVVGSI